VSHPCLPPKVYFKKKFNVFTIKGTIHSYLGKSEKCRKVKIRKRDHHPQPHHPETIIVKA
jgi:hypothetical protein